MVRPPCSKESSTVTPILPTVSSCLSFGRGRGAWTLILLLTACIKGIYVNQLANFLISRATHVAADLRDEFSSQSSDLRFAPLADLALAALPFIDAREYCVPHGGCLVVYVIITVHVIRQQRKLLAQARPVVAAWYQRISDVLAPGSDISSFLLLLTGAAKELMVMYCTTTDYYPDSVVLAHCLFVSFEVVVAAVHSVFYLTTMVYFYI
ncbi:uncharacterized protein [Dermacentor albipictus]|uniref:uncharacterized protein n=1 Tax=Dermacentor albipictus TaxID=60249 RepID=UPI0038FD071C